MPIFAPLAVGTPFVCERVVGEGVVFNNEQNNNKMNKVAESIILVSRRFSLVTVAVINVATINHIYLLWLLINHYNIHMHHPML